MKPETPSPLEDALADLRHTQVPEGLSDAVMQRLRKEPRWLGLPAREWFFVGASLGVFSVAVQAMVSYYTRLVL
jgi:hypothetical protein